MRQLIACLLLSTAGGTLVACGPSPSAPSVKPGISISDLRVQPLGIENAMCGGARLPYRSLDEITVNYKVTAGTVLGADLIGQFESNAAAPLGSPIQVCKASPDPCADRGRVCVTAGNPGDGGIIRTVVSTDWKQASGWLVNIVAPIGTSNQLGVGVWRPDGPVAGIYNLTIEECDYVFPPTKSSCYINPASYNNARAFDVRLVAYHPAIAGRSMYVHLEVFTPQSRRLGNFEMTVDEGATGYSSTGATSASLGGTILTSNNPPPPYRIVGTIRETQGGATIVEDTKEVSYP